MAVYNKIYDRVDKSNLACFYISDGVSDGDNTFAHASVVQGSILHCYKYVKSDSSDTASNTVKFYCSLSELTNGKTYRYNQTITVGDKPSVYIISSTGSIIQTKPVNNSVMQFTKTAQMDRILVTIEPTQKTKINTYVYEGANAIYTPYYQQVKQIKGTNLVNYKTGSTISGESEASFIVLGGNKADQIAYSKTLPVWGVALEGVGYPSTFDRTTYTKLWGRMPEYDMYWFVPTSNSYTRYVFNISAKIRQVMIPEGVNWNYTDIFRNLSVDGTVYVPEDSPVLTDSNFYKKFMGWTLLVYDTSPGDIVAKKVITDATSYAI